MTEIYLKKNSDGRFDCYSAFSDEYVSTLTCGDNFILITDDDEDYFDDLEVPGRIEYNDTLQYYWIDVDEFSKRKLVDGLKGFI